MVSEPSRRVAREASRGGGWGVFGRTSSTLTQPPRDPGGARQHSLPRVPKSRRDCGGSHSRPDQQKKGGAAGGAVQGPFAGKRHQEAKGNGKGSGGGGGEESLKREGGITQCSCQDLMPV